MKIECPNCNAAFEVEAKYVGGHTTCSACGNDFEIKNPNLTECPDCFASISRRALFCPHCGAGLKMSSFASAPSAVPAVESNEPEETLQTCHPAALNYLADIIVGIILIPVFSDRRLHSCQCMDQDLPNLIYDNEQAYHHYERLVVQGAA